ncbi:MAG TPA: thiolase family protein [Galbitalea sp.]|nr:thiolase family protein [Galbitalea sp.]
MSASYVYDAVRTPFGKFGKGLAGVRPDDLAASTLVALLARHPQLDPSRIDDVILGDANQAGEDNRNVARMAVLLAGLPVSVPGVTVNRLCGSGLDAVIDGSRAIETGDASVIVAGGVESMSRAPYVLPKPERTYPAGDETLVSTTLGWRLVNPKMPAEWTIPLGLTAEKLADRFSISREQQDAFALRSHRLAFSAWDRGEFDGEIVDAPVALATDETLRPDTTLEALGALKPAFRDGGTVTAGNSSSLNDGAALVLLGSERGIPGSDAKPLARITGRGVAGNEPDIFGIAPVEAANRALARAGRSWSDVDFVELNEAYASQVLACLALWPELDPERVNITGGAIAIGHPLGASGARVLGRAAHALAKKGSGVAVVAVCIGVGQGLAVVLER